MGWKYYFDGISLPNGRPVNMDSILLKELQLQGKDALLAVVCDGVGSLTHGGYAAGRTVEHLAQWMDTAGEIEKLAGGLERTLCWINTQLIMEMRAHRFQTASTATVLLLCEGRYWLTSVGDSRIYWYADGTLEQLTADTVTSDGRLSMYLGKSDGFSAEIRSGSFANGTFLLCSDGLYKRVSSAEIAAEVSGARKGMLRRTLDNLARLAIERGEKDNISIALIRCKQGGFR